MIAHEWIGNLLDQINPTRLVIEDYFFRGKFAMGANINPKIRGVFEMVASYPDRRIPYVMVQPTHWKKVIAGRATPTGSQKRKWKSKANKLFIVEALRERHGITCPVSMTNPSTGRLINFKYDISDALGILIADLIDRGIRYNVNPTIWDGWNQSDKDLR